MGMARNARLFYSPEARNGGEGYLLAGLGNRDQRAVSGKATNAEHHCDKKR
jgi:hypothetical protein